ncbi:MAG: hypothetical protein AAGF15_08285 [Pseudomonadota bacterium]
MSQTEQAAEIKKPETAATSPTRQEWMRIFLLIAFAFLLMIFVQPGLVESPYNEF